MDTQKKFPPVVSVLGHVDHGKTTLLDAIRKSNIASGETGGITQKIGASQIEVMHEGQKRVITFIDTPGHEAFSNMRSEGANAADIVLLIVASDDGLKPQTRESLKIIQQSNVPYIVVITKADLETAQIEKVKQMLLAEGVLLEGLGGDIPYITVSAKTNLRIHELLDLILLVHDMKEGGRSLEGDFSGVVIESKQDKKRGNIATIVVKQGILKVGEKLFMGKREIGKARALFNTVSAGIKEAYPGDACEILGISEIVPMGTVVTTKPHEGAPAISSSALPTIAAPVSLASFFAEKEKDAVSIILRTETSGEQEAIKNSLPEQVTVIFEGQGEISVSDILMAKDFKALVIGFNVGISKDAKELAENEKIFYKSYRIIYELLDELIDVIEMLGQEEKPLGKAEIIASFEGHEGKILGLRVLEGKLSVHDQISLRRGDTELGKAKITTLKRAKQEVKEVGKNNECGATLTPPLDFMVGDMILSHNTK